jgi:hypothetical protein
VAADGNWYPPELHPESGTAIVRPVSTRAQERSVPIEDAADRVRRSVGGARDADATIARALGDLEPEAPRSVAAGHPEAGTPAGDTLGEVPEPTLNRLPPLREMHGPISGGLVNAARREAAAAAARAVELGRTKAHEPSEFFAGRSTPLRMNVPAPVVVLLVVLLLALGGGAAYLLVH